MRPYGVFLVVSACTGFGTACAYTLNLVYQIRTAGLDPLHLVLVGTVLEVVYLLAQVPTGLIADLRSRRLSVIIGAVLTGGGTVLQGVAPTFATILVGTAVWGVGAACYDGAFEAWAADEIGEDRIGAALTRGAQLGQATTVLGMAVAAVLSAQRLWLPIVVGGTVWLALAGFLVAVMTEQHFHRVPARATFATARTDLRSGLRAARARPVLRALIGATLFVSLGREGYDRLSQNHLLNDHATALGLGGLAIATTLGAIPATEILRRRVDPASIGRTGSPSAVHS